MKKKINNSGTTDIFFEQLENTVHIESKDIPFGKEYHFKDFTSNKNSSAFIFSAFLSSASSIFNPLFKYANSFKRDSSTE